jgi:hypothetical protein
MNLLLTLLNRVPWHPALGRLTYKKAHGTVQRGKELCGFDLSLREQSKQILGEQTHQPGDQKGSQLGRHEFRRQGTKGFLLLAFNPENKAVCVWLGVSPFLQFYWKCWSIVIMATIYGARVQSALLSTGSTSTHATNYRLKIFTKIIVSILNMYRHFSLSLFLKQYGLTTIA